MVVRITTDSGGVETDDAVSEGGGSRDSGSSRSYTEQEVTQLLILLAAKLRGTHYVYDLTGREGTRFTAHGKTILRQRCFSATNVASGVLKSSKRDANRRKAVNLILRNRRSDVGDTEDMNMRILELENRIKKTTEHTQRLQQQIDKVDAENKALRRYVKF